MFNILTVRKQLFNETALWVQRVQAAGGGFETNSIQIANNLVRQIKNSSYGDKIIYLLPLLGTGTGGMRVPLIDTLNAGTSTTVGFVASDFSQAVGLQGNGSSKYLTIPIKPSQLGSSNNGGLGWWENNISLGANVEPLGCYSSDSSNRFVIDLRSSSRNFRWGNAGNSAADGVAAGNGHYYGQRSGATSRELFFNGMSLATNTTNDATSGASDLNMDVVGANEGGTHTPWPGRGAVAYFTDGTLASAQVSDFDIMLRNYLLGPTGKPQS